MKHRFDAARHPDGEVPKHALTRYSGFIETARTENRHGLPVGASYLRMGSRQLRSEVLPELSAIAATDTARISAAYHDVRTAALLFGGTALPGSALLIGAQYPLARITRSVFTPSTAPSGAVFVLATLAAVTFSGLALAKAGQVRAETPSASTRSPGPGPQPSTPRPPRAWC